MKVGQAIWYTIVAAFYALCALLGTGVVISLFGGDPFVFVFTPPVMTVVIGGVAALPAMFAISERWKLNRQRREQQLDAELAANGRLQQQRAGLMQQTVKNSAAAVDALAAMPQRLRLTEDSLARARRTYEDGAFSPFWSAIEAAYGHLGGYLSDANTITKCAAKHQELVGFLDTSGVDVSTAIEFPVRLDAVQVEALHAGVLGNLDALVYEAQKQTTFAVIWEQRRTTAAVVAGFATLEEVVTRMGARISSAISDLGLSLDRTTSKVEGFAASTGVSSDLLRAQVSELTQRATQIRDEMYYPGLGRYA